MSFPARSGRTAAALLVAVLMGGTRAAVAAKGAEKPGPAQPGGLVKTAPADAGWPRKVPLGEAALLLDAPQAESLSGTKLKARSAAEFRRAEGADPVFGVVWFEAEVSVDRPHRTVTFVSVQVPRILLAGVAPARLQRISAKVAQHVSGLGWSLSLDDVLASARLAARQEGPAPRLAAAPPRILFEPSPAVLVLFDGEPRFDDVEGTRLERAVNTAFLVLRDPDSGECFLDGGTAWFHAPDVSGPWSRAGEVPEEAREIAAGDRRDAGIPEADVAEAAKGADGRVPKIVVATEPTELIVSDGPPKWAGLVDGALETAANSESGLFRTPGDGAFWVVLSGRWYRAGSLDGPWRFVESDRLPPAFRKIPAGSPRADVLAFVAGTPSAREALKDASSPRTAAIRRTDGEVEVTWDGEPKFEAVPGTRVEYALNSPEQVLRIGGRYFVCDQGVWFTGEGPAGPWRVADDIPDDEIRAIPPESPVYNTRFVTVYDSTPDEVFVAYTPGYLGSYAWGGTVVYGTGWPYRPWWGAFYYPRPWTFGFHAFYRPWGGWGWGAGWWGFGGFRFGVGLGWGARWCGPAGVYRPAFPAGAARGAAASVYAAGRNAARTASVRVPGPKGTTVSKGTPRTSKSVSAPGAGKGAGARGKKPAGRMKPPGSKASRPGGRKG